MLLAQRPYPSQELRWLSGPYAQMIRCGEIAAQALEALGGSMDDVVRTRMFIVNTQDADDVGRVT